ncbi:hypothetical protein H9X96_03195 [Pedobacter sp. N36a]|uniref:hypothetical protein n=1 Tax=Pedobacter sp. N36a TaxID=2767996 RepID=UPI001656B967|nr:hypothetical protein [Pedobacter sp. N36a]MBC8984776.1 hypothetical protein [Pedobacter sp. N36a]
MKGKHTLLAAFLEKMSTETRTQIVKDLNEFIRSHPNNAANIEVDSLMSYHGLDRSPEEIESDRQQERFKQGLEQFNSNTPEARKASNVNIQEM